MNQNEQQQTKEFKGVFIPTDILQDPNLKGDEKILLALIDHYTTNGEKHACYLTNEQLADVTGISYHSLRDRVKPHLIQKGYVTTNGGIKSVSRNHDTNRVSRNHDTNRCDEIQQGYRETTIQIESVEDNSETTTPMSRNHDTQCRETAIQRNNKKEEKDIITKPILIKRDDTSANNTVVIDEVEDIPEWMYDAPTVEPFEQYTDDVQATDTVTDKVSNNTDSFGDIIADALQADEEEQTDLTQYEDVLPSDLSNPNNPFLGVPVDYLKADGTITHTDPESLSNGLKTTPVDLSTDKTETDTTDNNKNNTSIPMELTLTERKAKQAEITQKWKNFIQQVPTMDRETADKYLNNFIVAANKYFTGEYIERITTQWREQFEFTAKPPYDIEQAKRIVQNGVNQYAEQNTIARTLYSIFCKPVNRHWLETTIAEAKQKRDAERNQYKPDGDLPF